MHGPIIAYAARKSFFVGCPGHLQKQKLRSNFCTTVLEWYFDTTGHQSLVVQVRAMAESVPTNQTNKDRIR
jgi:hypothetical protein